MIRSPRLLWSWIPPPEPEPAAGAEPAPEPIVEALLEPDAPDAQESQADAIAEVLFELEAEPDGKPAAEMDGPAVETPMLDGGQPSDEVEVQLDLAPAPKSCPRTRP